LKEEKLSGRVKGQKTEKRKRKGQAKRASERECPETEGIKLMWRTEGRNLEEKGKEGFANCNKELYELKNETRTPHWEVATRGRAREARRQNEESQNCHKGERPSLPSSPWHCPGKKRGKDSKHKGIREKQQR